MFAKSVIALAPFAALAAAEVATFTHYGSGDSNGSANCKNPPAGQGLACGASYSNAAGYTAAISQNVYGVGPGAGAGPACGECWELTITGDENGNPVTSKTINVTVNNLCPAQGNTEWCDIPSGGTNQHGGQVHFDLCSDTGASDAFFTSVGAGKGTATQIQCGSGNAVESSSAAAVSSAAPSSAAASYAASSAAAAAASSPAAEASTPAGSAPNYKPSLITHSLPSFTFPGPQGGQRTSAAAGAAGSSPAQGGGYGGGYPIPSPVGGSSPGYTPGASPFGHGHPHGHGGHPHASGAAYSSAAAGAQGTSAGGVGSYGSSTPVSAAAAPEETDECGSDEE